MFLTPTKSVFQLDEPDLSSLMPDTEILGQVLDAILIIFASSARMLGINTLILPEEFFSRVNKDPTLEGCTPEDFQDINVLAAAIHHPHHWPLLLVDLKEKVVYYLEPMYTFVKRDRTENDLEITNRIIWHQVLGKDRGTDPPSRIPEWKYIMSASYWKDTGDALPKQHSGSDCGIFTAMYFFHLTMHAEFDFSQGDMLQFRKWMLAILLWCSDHPATEEQVCWMKEKIFYDRVWRLPLNTRENDLDTQTEMKRKQSNLLTDTDQPHNKLPRQDGEEDEFKLRERDAALAIAWIKNNKSKLSGTVRYPIAITTDDSDVIQRLEELRSKPCERWDDEDDDFFNCAWEFRFSTREDLEYAISELHDKQHLHLDFAC